MIYYFPDFEPPHFIGCPESAIEIILGPFHPVSSIIEIPKVTDNSNKSCKIEFDPPEFKLPFIFTKVSYNQALYWVSKLLMCLLLTSY